MGICLSVIMVCEQYRDPAGIQDYILSFLQLKAVRALLYTMGNSKYPDSQKQASISLEV